MKRALAILLTLSLLLSGPAALAEEQVSEPSYEVQENHSDHNDDHNDDHSDDHNDNHSDDHSDNHSDDQSDNHSDDQSEGHNDEVNADNSENQKADDSDENDTSDNDEDADYSEDEADGDDEVDGEDGDDENIGDNADVQIGQDEEADVTDTDDSEDDPEDDAPKRNHSEAAVESAHRSDTAAEEAISTKLANPAEDPASDGGSRKVRVAILSDIHYVPDALALSDAGRANLEEAGLSENRLMMEVDGILSAALSEASATKPNVLLVCGDMVSNGENAGAQALSEKLKASRAMEGLQNTGIYVVNGNHDINNSYASDFSGDTIENGKRVQPSEFSTIFSGLGYGADDHCEGGSHSVYVPSSDDPGEITNHGGLSYAADVAEGVTLIVLDTAIYRTDPDQTSRYNQAQKTPGYVSDDLLNWAAEQARAAKEKGNLVLAMSHHGLMPHYFTEKEEDVAWFMDNQRIPNWEKVAGTLADAGVSAVLTGHSHANDIASYVTANNNVIYDIETAALSAYPCVWRTMDIEISGEGANKRYTFSVDTAQVDAADLPEGTDTSKWTFTLGGADKTFQGDYNGSIQEYSYDKTGINGTTVPYMADYMIKNLLYDVAKEGLDSFIHRTLQLEEGQTVGDWAMKKLQETVAGLDGLDKNLDLSILGKYNIRLNRTEAQSELEPAFDVYLQNVTSETEGQAQTTEPEGKLIFDLSYITTAANDFIKKVQDKLDEGSWQNQVYGSSPLVDDLKKLVTNGLLPAMNKPLDEDNPNSTALDLFNHAWQAHAAGDEAKQDAEVFARERELLKSDALNKDARDGLWNELVKISTDAYPTLSALLSGQRVVAEDKTTAVAVQSDKAVSLLNVVSGLMGQIDTLSSVINLGGKVKALGVNLVPETAIRSVQNRIADLHEALSVDNDIREDNQWSFKTVRFDANGGKVTQTSGTTVEDHKLASLPRPEARRNYVFAGWFTEATGGRRVAEGDDMTGVSTLYAHWKYVGRPDDDVPVIIDDDDEQHTRSATETAQDVAVDLHARLSSRKALHARIDGAEADDPEHAAFCSRLAERIESGENRVDMGKWISLDARAVSAITSSGMDIILDCEVNGFRFRVVIPAGASLRDLALEDGSVCVVCLAEAFGYQAI